MAWTHVPAPQRLQGSPKESGSSAAQGLCSSTIRPFVPFVLYPFIRPPCSFPLFFACCCNLRFATRSGLIASRLPFCAIGAQGFAGCRPRLVKTIFVVSIFF